MMASFDVAKEDEILLLLVHFFVEEESDYLLTKLDFSTKTVAEMCMNKLFDHQPDKMKDLLSELVYGKPSACG
jgi:hypothetical protein